MSDKTVNFRLPGWVTPPGFSRNGRSSPRPILRNFRLAEPDPDSDVEKQLESSQVPKSRSNQNLREISSVRQWPLVSTPYLAALPSPTEKETKDGREQKKGKDGRFSGLRRPHTHIHHPHPKNVEKERDETQIPLPSHWRAHIHPKGWIYYTNPRGRPVSLVTDYKMQFKLGQQEFEAAMRSVGGYGYDYGGGSAWVYGGEDSISSSGAESSPDEIGSPKQDDGGNEGKANSAKKPQKKRARGFSAPDFKNRLCELWIDYELVEGRQVAEKQFIDHERRRLTRREPVHEQGGLYDDGSWLEPKEEIGVAQGMIYEQDYWNYMINHPCHAPLPSNAEEDALAALSWYAQDRLINPEDSLSPYSIELCQQLISQLTMMIEHKEIYEDTRNRPVKTLFVASVLERVVGERLRQHYGQHDARYYLKHALRRRVGPTTSPFFSSSGGLTSLFSYDSFQLGFWSFVLDLIMTGPCFGVPYAYFRQIDEFFTTRIGRTDTITERWKQFVDDNVADWQNTNLVATVLVSASVALLAIPGIDSVTRAFGIISTLSSIASIISGLLNVWQHQHKSRSSLELTTIFDFFGQAERGIKSDKLLALLLSLPMVLLIWGTLLFAGSMVSFSWRGVDPTYIDALANIQERASASEDGTEVMNLSPEDLAIRFGPWTAWLSSSLAAFLTAIVLSSFVFFWRAWRPRDKKKKGKMTWRGLFSFR